MGMTGTGQLAVWLWKRDWYGSGVESVGFQVGQTWILNPSLLLCGLLSSYKLGDNHPTSKGSSEDQ